jgi:hypothetical protein
MRTRGCARKSRGNGTQRRVTINVRLDPRQPPIGDRHHVGEGRLSGCLS